MVEIYTTVGRVRNIIFIQADGLDHQLYHFRGDTQFIAEEIYTIKGYYELEPINSDEDYVYIIDKLEKTSDKLATMAINYCNELLGGLYD